MAVEKEGGVTGWAGSRPGVVVGRNDPKLGTALPCIILKR